MRASISVDALYFGKDIYKGLEEIKSCGYDNFEMWGWWDKDITRLIEIKNRLEMNLTACCTKFISLVDHSEINKYIDGLKESIDAAKKLGCTRLISQTGNDTGKSRQHQQEAMINGLRTCAPLLEESGITLVVEPLNTRVDHKGYYLWSSDEGFRIIEEVGSPNIKLLYDIYHQQIMEGDILRRVVPNITSIGHFHAAGNPGRNELYYGVHDYNRIFKAIKDTGYKSYIGYEYFPVDPVTEKKKKTRDTIL